MFRGVGSTESAALDVEDGVVTAARVAVKGAKPYPSRLSGVGSALVDETADDGTGDRVADAALRGVDPGELLTNRAAAGRYRLRLVRSYCRRAIDRAVADR